MTRIGTFALVLLPMLAGCALFESSATRALRATPEYRAGHGDGCASAAPSANPRADTRVRDENAYRQNAAYRRGWNEGFGACRGPAQFNRNGSINPLNR